MDSVSELWRRLRYLLSRSRFDEDLQEEMRLHLELRTAEQSAAGMPPEDAASAAKKRFGNRTRVLESSREAWGWTFWETLAKDIRHGIRTLAADRGFAVAAVLSLVLGIGANTAVFSILNAVMLRTLPVQEPGALAVVKFGDNGFLTNPLWEEIRDRQSAFSGVLTYSPDDFDLAEGGEVQLTHGVWVNGDYFHTLGVPAIRGRTFTPEDDLHGGGRSGPVAVVSYAFWQDHFAGDPGIVGKTVKLNRHPFEIIGVTPPWFKGLDVDQPFAYLSQYVQRRRGAVHKLAIRSRTGKRALQDQLKVIAGFKPVVFKQSAQRCFESADIKHRLNGASVTAIANESSVGALPQHQRQRAY